MYLVETSQSERTAVEDSIGGVVLSVVSLGYRMVAFPLLHNRREEYSIVRILTTRWKLQRKCTRALQSPRAMRPNKEGGEERAGEGCHCE